MFIKYIVSLLKSMNSPGIDFMDESYVFSYIDFKRLLSLFIA